MQHRLRPFWYISPLEPLEAGKTCIYMYYRCSPGKLVGGVEPSDRRQSESSAARRARAQPVCCGAHVTNTAGTAWLHRLRERGVIRVAASYAVIAWLLLQIADVTFEPLGVPRWVMVSLIVTAMLGFPVAVALAWFYEAGDSGVARDTAAEGVPRPVVHGLRRYADLAIIGVLLGGGRRAAGPAIGPGSRRERRAWPSPCCRSRT